MIAHGVSTGALFLLAGFLEQRNQSLEISDFGGLAFARLAWPLCFLIALFASIGLPTLCNFVGEFLILQGAALAKFSWAAWAALGVILSAAYMLWMYQRTFFGKPNERNEGFVDLAGSRLASPASASRDDRLARMLYPAFPAADFRIHLSSAGADHHERPVSCFAASPGSVSAF